MLPVQGADTDFLAEMQEKHIDMLPPITERTEPEATSLAQGGSRGQQGQGVSAVVGSVAGVRSLPFKGEGGLSQRAEQSTKVVCEKSTK